MKLVISDEDKLESWETLINTVDKSDVPIQFVNGINLVFHKAIGGELEQDMDIQLLREHGWQNSEIEEIVQQVLVENQSNIKTIHLYLDVEHVAEVVQNQTNKMLEGIK